MWTRASMGDVAAARMAFRRLAVVVAVAFFLMPQASPGHDNIYVHRKLGEWSVSSLNNPFFFPYSAEVREGSYGEDVPATRSLGHFYNPQTDSAPWFATGSGPAWQNSQSQYNSAISEYQAGRYTGTDAAFYRMGRALHFIQDMTSPAHTHDDQHATDDEDFENWGPGVINSFDFSNVPPKMAATPTAEGFVKEIGRLVYDMTAYQADIDENTGPQLSSEFKSMFPSLHWVDGGTFGDDVWVVDRVGTFDCFGNGIFCNDGWWMISETLTENNSGRGGSRRLRGYAYIENTGGSGGQPVPLVFKGVPNSGNETLLQIYGRLLYPEAVAYGAGLLQVFAAAVGAPPTATPTMPPTSPTVTPTWDVSLPTHTPTSTATPTISPSATITPTQPTATPTWTAVPTPLCGATPRVDCRIPQRARKSSITMVNKTDDTRDALTWKWGQGNLLPSELGNPVEGTNYALCIYDEVDMEATLAMQIHAPAGALCSGMRCWSSSRGGFTWSDRGGSSHGLRSLVIKSSPSLGKGKIVLKAKGRNLPLPTPASPTALMEQTVRLQVQLVNSLGVCWGASFTTPASRNTVEKFNDKSD